MHKCLIFVDTLDPLLSSAVVNKFFSTVLQMGYVETLCIKKRA